MLDGFGSTGLALIVVCPVIVVFATMFACALSRISDEDGAITLIRAFDRLKIEKADILDAWVFAFRPNRYAGVRIILRNRRYPVFAHFVMADLTSAGDFDSTVVALQQMLSRHLPTSRRVSTTVS
jgi:hypothetical protein